MWDASLINFRRHQDEATWRKNFAALIQFFLLYHHCNVPLSDVFVCDITTPEGEKLHYEGRLGKWIEDQKASGGVKKRAMYKLTAAQDDLLNKLLFHPLSTTSTWNSVSKLYSHLSFPISVFVSIIAVIHFHSVH